MSKKRWSTLLAIFFLVQSVQSPAIFSFETSPLNPPTNIDANYSDGVVKKIYDAVCLGISLYKLDTVERLPEEEIGRSYAGLSPGSEVHFDLANMDLGRKGWTRYYPFFVGDKAFIMRIFLTAETAYQSPAPVLYEGAIANPAVTFQVLPSINEMISGPRIKPHRIYASHEVDHSL